MLLWALLACMGGDKLLPGPSPTQPRLPEEGRAFAPSQLRLDAEHPLSAAELADTATCAGCHEEIAQQLASSAHGRASLDNPWYRASVDALREEAGLEASVHCGGCHDPTLVLSGTMAQPFVPENPHNTVGVGCLMCHGATEVRPDGNASLTLAGGQILAIEGDETTTELHKAAMAPEPLRTAGLCASCHRGFLGPDTGNTVSVVGMDDAGAWRGGPWAGSRASVMEPPGEQRICQDCHMPQEQTPYKALASHRFPGAHTALADLVGDPAQRQAIEAMLRSAAVIDVVGVRQQGQLSAPERLSPQPGPITLELVIRNEGAGHSFPAGIKDTQDTWVELVLITRTGRVLGSSGVRPNDPEAHRLDSAPLDTEGRREQAHRTARFVAPAWDHTVPPRQSKAVRYTVELPELSALDWPLQARARLQHRSHAQPMQDFACAAGLTPEGLAIREASRTQGLPDLDACQPPPVTLVSETTVYLGPGALSARGGAERPAARRWLDLAQGLSNLESERLDEARPALAFAREAAKGDPWLLAEADWLEAILDGKQGRADQAAARVAEASARVGPQPALARALGRAMARVWRWEEASAALADAAKLAPQDTAAWRELAQALGSLGRSSDSLKAAITGLGFWPRDPALLRSQALALRALEHPLAPAAEQRWLEFRGPDDLSGLVLACEQREPGCLARRAPVPSLPLR